jgi:hypothetical protein
MTTTTHGNLSLTLSIGNAATQEPAALAALMREAAELLEGTTYAALADRSMRLRDMNGNTVGHLGLSGYSVDQDDAEED